MQRVDVTRRLARKRYGIFGRSLRIRRNRREKIPSSLLNTVDVARESLRKLLHDGVMAAAFCARDRVDTMHIVNGF